MKTEKDIEYLDEKFPKGKTKFRGEAMVLLTLARIEGEQKRNAEVKQIIDKGLKETEKITKEQFRDETILEYGYHSKHWKIPKHLLTEMKIAVLLELLQKLGLEGEE